MTIGKKIKYYRNKSGMTQNELAAKANIHPVTIRKYETDRYLPSYNHIKKISKALNISNVILIMSEIKVDTLWCNCYNKLERLLLSNCKITGIDEKQVDANTVFIGITLNSKEEVAEYLNNILEKE